MGIKLSPGVRSLRYDTHWAVSVCRHCGVSMATRRVDPWGRSYICCINGHRRDTRKAVKTVNMGWA